jgi:3-hydroxyacyl-[acyl-carrier-protein] dehydratase
MKPIPLQLGPDLIQRLIPHRRPFLLLDGVEAFTRGQEPSLTAFKLLSASDPVFEGHFPGLHLWPGVFTIEGLGQTGNVLQVLCAMEEAWTRRGRDPDEVLAALRNLELGYRLRPGYRPELLGELEAVLSRSAMSRTGFSASVEVKLLAPVFAGQRLDYRVTRTRLLEDFVRFGVEASVEGKAVARGELTSSLAALAPPAGGPR